MPFPHPRAFFTAIRLAVALAMLAYGIIGAFKPALLVPFFSQLVPQIPAASLESVIMISSFVSIILGLALLMKG
jgi:uncharacterized membrane protein